MASSSSSHYTPASSPESWNHDVFLSFRGEDTRKTFIDHLYTALVQQGIYAYKDDETLPRGELIGPALMKAIRESRIAIIVFSEKYANSSWCLDELAYIMKCKHETGQIVIPIFYHVDPSEVRRQSGKFREAFAKHELVNTVKVESWRRALVDAGSLSGWVPTDIVNGHESKGIKEIVDGIAKTLLPLYPEFDEDLVGLRTRLQYLKSKLEISLGGVHMVGIWGLGGGGKTTLASSLYYEIISNFDGCCFVENIREESSKHGLKTLQVKILSDVLKQERVDIGRVEEGRRMIKRRLCHKKVLIVLDHVDHVEQLKALAGSCDWFGAGSRIIITTRDEHLLKAHKVNVIHDINLLDDKEAMELFCKHAPRDNMCLKDYELLSKAVVSYASGLPLALKVLGCFLCDKDINEWRDTLDRLKEIPDGDIVGKLKISYNGLTSVEKNLFLDIACFFRKGIKDEAMEIFDACGYYLTIGIKVLMQKTLITISDNGEFDMHDLIQEMAHYIVRGDHPDNPEKHSRVWDEKDVRKLCAMDATMANIEAIKFISYVNRPLYLHDYHVANMKKLRWIKWKGPFECSLLENFQSRELRCLIMEGGIQRHLWKNHKYPSNLRMIKLHGLHNLIKTPDFGGLPNLERIILIWCPELKEIHPSIGNLERLVYLKVSCCDNLETFPLITRSHKLETYILQFSKKLFKVHEIQLDKKMESLKHVDLGLHADTEDDLSIDAKFCLEEPPLPQNNIFNPTSSQLFHTNLKLLDLGYCSLENGHMDYAVWDLPNLKELNLVHNNFSRLNLGLCQLPRLKWLDVTHCNKLVEMSGLPPSIAVFIADFCTALKTIGDISNHKWLWKASLRASNYGLGLPHCDFILESILQGNAIEHHFINFTTRSINHFPNRLAHRLVRLRGNTTYRLMKLPLNWYSDFSGFLICTTFDYGYEGACVWISITNESNEVYESDHDSLSKESNKVFEPYCCSHSNNSHECNVGYVSFNSIVRETTSSNSTYNIVSVSSDKDPFWCAAELVPRENKKTTKIEMDSSEIFDKENKDQRMTFTMQTSFKVLHQGLMVSTSLVSQAHCNTSLNFSFALLLQNE